MFIDYSKYKRFFAFGCSFTNHIYPTWADVLSSEMPGATFYNCGKSGAGNPLITARFTEANKKFNFNSEDLVILMFTSFYREDRYLNKNWVARGNVYNGCIYGEQFVKQFADPVGYLIRDYSLIELSINYAKLLPCKTIFLSATTYHEDLFWAKNAFDMSVYNEDILETIFNTYKSTLNSLPISLEEYIKKDTGNWLIGHTYYKDKNLINDPHPNPKMYHDYLKFLQFNLTDKSDNYVTESMIKLNSLIDESDWTNLFPEIGSSSNRAARLLF